MATAKIKVSELAKKLGMTNAEMLDLCRANNVAAKTPQSTLVEAFVPMLERKARAQGLVRDVQPEEDKPVKKAAAPKKAAAKTSGAADVAPKKAPAKKAVAPAKAPAKAAAPKKAVAPEAPKEDSPSVPVQASEPTAPAAPTVDAEQRPSPRPSGPSVVSSRTAPPRDEIRPDTWRSEPTRHEPTRPAARGDAPPRPRPVP
ncbi:MAG: hypothetical protein ACKOBT_13295, partial [Actinomycetota bacterium]